jgi:hypothetical protein
MPVDSVPPFLDFDPCQAPEPLQRVASETVHVIVAESPEIILVGETLILIVGSGNTSPQFGSTAWSQGGRFTIENLLLSSRFGRLILLPQTVREIFPAVVANTKDGPESDDTPRKTKLNSVP